MFRPFYSAKTIWLFLFCFVLSFSTQAKYGQNSAKEFITTTVKSNKKQQREQIKQFKKQLKDIKKTAKTSNVSAGEIIAGILVAAAGIALLWLLGKAGVWLMTWLGFSVGFWGGFLIGLAILALLGISIFMVLLASGNI